MHEEFSFLNDASFGVCITIHLLYHILQDDAVIYTGSTYIKRYEHHTSGKYIGRNGQLI